jgi:hypothetical protein
VHCSGSSRSRNRCCKMQQAGVGAAFSGGLGASPIPTTCGPQPPSSIPPSPSFFQVEVGPLRQSAHPGPPVGGGRGRRQIRKMRPLASPRTAPPPCSRRRRGSPAPRRRGRRPAADCSRAGDPARSGGSRSRRLHLRPHPSCSISIPALDLPQLDPRGGTWPPFRALPSSPPLPRSSRAAGVAPLSSRSSLRPSSSSICPREPTAAVVCARGMGVLLEAHLCPSSLSFPQGGHRCRCASAHCWSRS